MVHALVESGESVAAESALFNSRYPLGTLCAFGMPIKSVISGDGSGLLRLVKPLTADLQGNRVK